MKKKPSQPQVPELNVSKDTVSELVDAATPTIQPDPIPQTPGTPNMPVFDQGEISPIPSLPSAQEGRSSSASGQNDQIGAAPKNSTTVVPFLATESTLTGYLVQIVSLRRGINKYTGTLQYLKGGEANLFNFRE